MSPPHLDHLILFLPAAPSQPSGSASPLLPASFQKAFTPFPGGQHADNLTANTLLLLADGSYLELICWVPGADAKKKEEHWWAGAERGWRDWCLGTAGSGSKRDGEEDEATRNWERLEEEGLKGTYLAPQQGGRKRPDGVEVRWSVTFPSPSAVDVSSSEGKQRSVRGLVPFFCHDFTPRSARVPVNDAEKTRHPCGALGVLELTVLVGEKEVFEQVKGVYARVFGGEELGGEGEALYTTSRAAFSTIPAPPRIRLRLAQTEVEKALVRENGFCMRDVVLAAAAEEGVEGREKGTRVRIDSEGGDDSVGGLWVEYL